MVGGSSKEQIEVSDLTEENKNSEEAICIFVTLGKVKGNITNPYSSRAKD